MDRTKELEEQVLKLSLKVDEMRNRMVRLEGASPENQNGSAPRSRRGFLRMGLAAAAGAVGLTALKVVPTSAANGGALTLGQANLASLPTTLQGQTSDPIPTFAVEDQNFSQAALTTALTSVTPNPETFNAPFRALGPGGIITEGIDAWAGGAQAYGVYGFTDAGTGVTGESLTGIGLYSRGTGRIRQDPMVAAGAPNFDPNLFEQIRDVNGVLWISGAIGVQPAVWRRVNSLRFDRADGTGGFFKPFRLVDTRSGAPKASSSRNTHLVAGQGAGASLIPADAVGVVGNLVAISYTSVGFLTIMPSGVPYNPATDTASVNFITGQGATGNSFAVGIGAGGSVDVFVGSPGTSHYVIDITGYIQ